MVPGIAIDDAGRARSWWWPLPAARDRAAIAALCADGSPQTQRIVAEQLAMAVDRTVRHRLGEHRVGLTARRSGRRSIEDAWLSSLTASDPWLARSYDIEKLRAFEREITRWVASGAATMGSVRLCLRVREPALAGVDANWSVELLVQDTGEPSLIVAAADVWGGRSPFGPHAVEELLASLGRVARLAPELAMVLDESAPSEIELSTALLMDFLTQRIDTLADAGIAVLLPAWWAQRRRLGLRVKAKSARSGAASVVAGGIGMDAVVAFSFEAALGEHRLTTAELRALTHAVEAKQALVRVRGEWIEVGAGEFAKIVAYAGTTGEATVAEVLRSGMGLDGLAVPDGIEITSVAATGWLGDLLHGALHSVVAPVPTPDRFVGQLRPYQERGVGWLSFLGRLGLGACLADDMGLGKTAQLIATLLSDDAAAGPTLVVCPVSVLGNWQRELARFAPQLRVVAHHGADRFTAHRTKFATRAKRADVVLTTYSLAARDIAELEGVQWTRLVLDEAQQIKNPGTAQTRAVQRLRADKRVAMTGTPVENRLSELWSIMHVLNPGLLGTQRGFRERFAIPIERENDAASAEQLKRITAPFVLRRLKTDKTIIDDLPDKIEVTEHCPLTREQATLYQAVVEELISAAAEAEGINRRGLVLAGLMRLKQVCNHPAHFLRDGSTLSGRSGKLTRAEELVEEIVAAGDKVLCFTQFAEWGNLLAPHWSRRFGTSVGWLHGGVARKKRDAMVAEFQESDGPGIFLISLKAGGTGLNLTAATHVIHLDRWWNPAVEDQATDRAYRIGQRRAVLVHKLVSTGTVEERIDAMITSKRALAERVVGTGEQWITELSTADLRATIALSAEIGDD
ncbi:MAG: DEAD/DEAH box helicase [Acidimicrobiales bacterium]